MSVLESQQLICRDVWSLWLYSTMFYMSDNYFLSRAIEIKEHPYFKGLDWTQVYLQKYHPPLIPPRGEVNAADAFDIGSFDEEDTKGIKVLIQPDILL